ncbi:hypothetical protein ELUMI_v1c01370 [Williamsoniiplasma luminosum]|uniref:Lipoprotein n=1 Tax=Williamsoniiplasma luminosum TaxID=214888 RepID=A0A2K8NW46_9MOLU|nr:hypothetical protein [Williamsoniiplasma luminosum]ATZ16863.1 hypothetical protein ELUMI_v1c01370 [Williamsoniiplasma luminosum]
MKKILSILMGLTVTSSAALTVVSCEVPVHKVPIKFDGDFVPNEGNWSEYNDADRVKAFQGNFLGDKSVAFDNTIARLRNLLSLTPAFINDKNRFSQYNELLIGADADDESKTAAVHGIYRWEKTQGEKPLDFYNKFKKTNISSIGGLYWLHKVKREDLTADAAKAAWDLAEKAFGTPDSAGADFVKNFLGLDSNLQDSSWTEQHISKTDNPKISLMDSKVVEFTSKVEGESAEINEPVSETLKEFEDVNTGIDYKEKIEKVGQDKSKPFNQFIFGGKLPTTHVKVIEKPTIEKPAEANPKDVQVDWIIIEKSTEKKEDKTIHKWNPKDGQFFLGDETSITINYKFTTDSKNEQAEKYNVKTTFSGMKPVFRPIIKEANLKAKDGSTTKTYFAKWTFVGYQFNDQHNFIKDGNKDIKPGQGLFSNIKLTELNITKA